MNKQQLYIGLMSGTSADGIDLALVDFSSGSAQLVSRYYQAYDQNIRTRITGLYQPGNNEIDQAFALDVDLAKQFSQAINTFIKQENLTPTDISAIGNHGQTIRHRPTKNANISAAFTLQIGCNQTLATLTNIRVIGQFRRKDMALGGQGAPLVPAFHQALFANPQEDVFVVNIGGIANITYLPANSFSDGKNNDSKILGFDTGPGNALMDDWYQQHHQGSFDKNGDWAKSGTINTELLSRLLADAYFDLPAPKSTGREYFHLTWLTPYINNNDLPKNDVQATLTALTAMTISKQIVSLSSKATIYLCGGGALNAYLVALLQQQLKDFSMTSTTSKNIDSDSLEAMAFSWLAFAYDHNITGNIPAVTGASKAAVLGTCFQP